MRLPALLLCVTALTVAAAPAGAVPKCPSMLTDPQGDTTLRGAPGTGWYDIVAGDVAGGRSEVVAVLRVAASDGSRHTLESEWQLGAVMRGVTYAFRASTDAAGVVRFSVTVGGVPLPTASFQTGPGNTLVWRFKQDPSRRFAAGSVTEMSAETTATIPMDTAHAKVSRRSGRSCVAAR